MRRKTITIAFCAAVALGSALFYSRLQSVPAQFYMVENARRPTRTREEAAQWGQKSRLLLSLWHARSQQDPAPRLMKMVNDPDANIRERAVRLLGRLGAAQALPLLQRKAQAVERAMKSPPVPNQGSYQDASDYVPLEVLQLAIGRIQSRSLRARDKLDKMLQAVQFADAAGQQRNLKWADVREFSRYANVVVGQEHLRFGSPGRGVFDEVVDVLHQEKAAGRDVKALQQQLHLSEAQKMFLDVAALPVNQRIRRVIEFGLGIKVYGTEESRLITGYLISLPPKQVRQEVHRTLENVIANPKKYPTMSEVRFGNKYATGLLPLWNIASVIGNAETKTLLAKFARRFDTPWIGGEATQVIERLDKRQGTVLFPQ